MPLVNNPFLAEVSKKFYEKVPETIGCFTWTEGMDICSFLISNAKTVKLAVKTEKILNDLLPILSIFQNKDKIFQLLVVQETENEKEIHSDLFPFMEIRKLFLKKESMKNMHDFLIADSSFVLAETWVMQEEFGKSAFKAEIGLMDFAKLSDLSNSFNNLWKHSKPFYNLVVQEEKGIQK